MHNSATVSHDVSYLGSVLDAAKPVYGINYTSNPAKSARPYLLKLGLIGKSNRRNRRPASDELDMLIAGLQQRSTHKCSKIPFVDILKFSVYPVCESEKYAGYDGKISTRNKNLYS